MNVHVFVTTATALAGEYMAELAGLVAGVGAIAARDYGPAVTDALQSVVIVCGSISVIGLRRGVGHVHQSLREIAERIQ